MKPRFHLRTLLLLLALLPPILAVGWWKYSAWRAEQQRQAQVRAALEWLGKHQAPMPWFIPADP